jgi:DNA-binding MarR family transcriptional regulator
MELEKEIQQTKFRNERHKAVLNILFTASWLQCLQPRLFKQYGLTPQQYNVLRILRGQKGTPITVNGIQERMLDRSSNASRLIDKLKEKQLVTRLECPTDRRQMDIQITPEGLELLKRMDGQMDATEASFGVMTEADATELNRILDRMREEN